MTTVNNTSDKSAGISGAPGDVAPPKKSALASLKPEDFMKILVEQLKHQNPMQPTDTSAMLQQMSQIGQINASQDMQNTMNNLANSMNATMANTQVLEATQIIGKHVQIPSTVSKLVDKEGLSGSVMVPGAANDVTVMIHDSAGNIIQKIDLGKSTQKGLMDFTWDGTSNGKAMPPDFYQISAVAKIKNQDVPVPTAGSFKVNSVAFDPSVGVILNVDGLGGQDMGSIIKIVN